MTTTTPKRRWFQVIAPIWVSLLIAAVVLYFDAVRLGTCMFSYLACPIWFLVSAVKNLVGHSGRELTLFRIAMPALTLGIAFGNNAIQWEIADANAERIIKACEEFHGANNRYPQSLNELVPRYLRSVPRAKYCLDCGNFEYFNSPNDLDLHCNLMWYKIPPFGRKIYDFQTKRWGYID